VDRQALRFTAPTAGVRDSLRDACAVADAWKDSGNLESRFVRIGAGRHRSYVGVESRAGLFQVEHVALRVAVRSVTSETTPVTAGREASNHLTTYLADWSCLVHGWSLPLDSADILAIEAMDRLSDSAASFVGR